MLPSQAHRFVTSFLLYFYLITLCTCNNDNQENDMESILRSDTLQINVTGPSLIKEGDNATFSCHVKPSATQIWWMYEESNITQDGEKYTIEHLPHTMQETLNHIILTIHNVGFDDSGNYSCFAVSSTDLSSSYATLNVSVPVTIVDKANKVRSKIDGQVELFCEFKGFPLSDFYWIKENESSSITQLKSNSNITWLSKTNANFTLNLKDLSRKDNGTYNCKASGLEGEVGDSVTVLVIHEPQVWVDVTIAVGEKMIYLNWTTNNGNDPNISYIIQFMKKGTGEWQYYYEQIGGGNNSYVLKNLDKGSEYKFRISAKNSVGTGHYAETGFVRTLDEDPNFIPDIQVNGVTFNSITIGWSVPPPELKGHFHYYELIAKAYNSSESKEAIESAQDKNLYLFTDLLAATTYNFKVRPCSEYTKQCGQYSNVVNGTTMDGLSGPPKNVSVQCKFDDVSQRSFVFVSWEPPINPNGKIIYYQVVLEGGANFRNEKGILEHGTYGPKIKSVDEKSHSATFDMIPANTNYTVKVSGTTRTKKIGETVSRNCSMPPTIPDKDKMQKFSWSKFEEHGKYVFKLSIPKISERNGAICCYRVFMVRMPSHKSIAELPSPEDSLIFTYQQVHGRPKGGAYVAEMFTSDALLSVVFLGDGYILNTTNSACIHCVGLRPRTITEAPNTDSKKNDWSDQIRAHRPSLMTTQGSLLNLNVTTSSPTTTADSSPLVITDEKRIRREQFRIFTKRERRDNTPTLVQLSKNESDKADENSAYDGYLDTESNYTAFIEIMVHGAEQPLAAYTNYLEVQRPAPDALSVQIEDPTTEALSLAAQILCALILAVLALLIALCLLHRYTKQVARAQGIEMSTFRNSFRHLCRGLRGRHQLVSSHPPDMTPIMKAELFDAYMERHRDSDYGFQQEFEQLPDRFADRTTRASDARENLYKNRYPDIKAYDQTRVKLSQIDSIAGSDYINANIVLGYKERKKFICAQGPMDNTVCDYWRMIWEQRLELIMMLTNLEEYSKTKCAKYWPEKTEGDKNFGDISVTHINEKRYSDYIIRELKVSRTLFGRDKEERFVTQYHFLVWKDFMAPEHPHGILKFIKRMNEAYSLERGPILVHCSAGVGRTGTLVALDSLLQQLKEEDQVAIFNTICDLRHQRNFLVQSLKQYIFVYRALMEVAQYGDTEIPANKLKTTVEELKKRDNDKDKSKMEDEYDNIKQVLEDRKPFSVGGAEENQSKNRSELIIPYDRNRVILTPMPGREHSTYINASFIEGYDNSESFIITQDPLDSTIPDFWRMISEQGIGVIVMLSELGGSENTKKCPRYWPDDEITYDHIKVKFIQSESCPYYTRRELSVTNKKSEETVLVTQLQYHGWPTVEGEVPEVTRGLIELGDQAQSLQLTSGNSSAITSPPICVHCNFGSDRSSMFVGLCILIQQLRIEKHVDIFTTTRKLRSQRNGMLNTFAQYEFLHRAIVNYADLHHLYEDDT